MPEHEAQQGREDIALLLEAGEEAAKIARHYFGRDPKVWQKGVDDPVTEADLAIDKMLRSSLLEARPEYGWLSEETEDDPARLHKEHVFICDPIDGTRAFIKGEKSFAVSLALVQHGKPIAAVIVMPMLNLTYSAVRGGGAQLSGELMRASNRALEGASLLTPQSNLNPEHWPGGIPPVERAYRPSLAYRMALVAEGRFDAMLTLRDTWEWDVAAGTLLVTEARGAVTDSGGQPLVFNGESPKVSGVICGGGAVHAGLLKLRAGAR